MHLATAVTSETRFSEYEPVNGVLMARRLLEVDLATGKVLAESRKVTVEANTLRDLFDLQSEGVHALNSATSSFSNSFTKSEPDPISVMYTYRTFQRRGLSADR